MIKKSAFIVFILIANVIQATTWQKCKNVAYEHRGKIAFIGGWIACYQFQCRYGLFNTNDWGAHTDKDGNLVINSGIKHWLATLVSRGTQEMENKNGIRWIRHAWGYND